MDFRFTEEQDMTAEFVRGLLADHCRPSDLRRLMECGAARDAARWENLIKMGLQGALVSDHKGGLGLKPVDLVKVGEACGYACLPEPLLENACVAVPLLADIAGNDRARELLAKALSGEITIALAHPVNPFVADADSAGALLVTADDQLYLIDQDNATLTRQQSTDPFRRLFAVEATLSAETEIAKMHEVRHELTAALDRGALFTAAQLVGIAQRAVDMAVDYAKERTQFGKPIGANQSVKHLLATAQVKIEFARPVVHAAAAQLPNADVYSEARVSHAKLAASEAADLACRTAVQVHGAMGYSWEVDVHFFLKRALALSGWWGSSRFHQDRVTERMLTRPLGPEHTFTKETGNA